MKLESQSLIEGMIDSLVKLANDQRQLGTILMRSNDAERSEIAYYIEDKLTWHRDLPLGASTSLSLIEQFIAHRIKVADWHARRDQLDDEWDTLHQALLLDDVDDAAEPRDAPDEILNW